MVEDRYAVNKPLYTLGMFCLICAMALLMFALYIVPRLLWSLQYDVPAFVTEGQVWFQEEWLWSKGAANWMMFGIFFVPGVLLACISDWVSKRIESQMPELPVKPILEEAHQTSRKNRLIALQLASVILLIVCGFWLLNLMLS
jgi:hypothetical protein